MSKQTAKEWIAEKEREELAKVLDFFGGAKNLADLLDIPITTALGWVERGRISATGAAKLEQMLPDTFSASELRPDVKAWFHKTQQGAK